MRSLIGRKDKTKKKCWGWRVTWPQKKKSKCWVVIHSMGILAEPGIAHWRCSNIYGLIACWHPSKILFLNKRDIWCWLAFWFFPALMNFFAIVHKQPTFRNWSSLLKKYIFNVLTWVCSQFGRGLLNVILPSLLDLFCTRMLPTSFLSHILTIIFHCLYYNQQIFNQ